MVDDRAAERVGVHSCPAVAGRPGGGGRVGRLREVGHHAIVPSARAHRVNSRQSFQPRPTRSSPQISPRESRPWRLADKREDLVLHSQTFLPLIGRSVSPSGPNFSPMLHPHGLDARRGNRRSSVTSHSGASSATMLITGHVWPRTVAPPPRTSTTTKGRPRVNKPKTLPHAPPAYPPPCTTTNVDPHAPAGQRHPDAEAGPAVETDASARHPHPPGSSDRAPSPSTNYSKERPRGGPRRLRPPPPAPPQRPPASRPGGGTGTAPRSPRQIPHPVTRSATMRKPFGPHPR